MRAGLVLVLLLSASTSAAATSGVHLTWMGDAYGVTFSDANDAAPVVRWRGPDGEGSVPAEPTSAVERDRDRSYFAMLPPGVTRYEVGGRSADLRPPPTEGDAVRVVFFADSGHDEESWSVMDAMAAAEPGLALAGGDLSYAEGREHVLDDWLARLEPLAMRAPVMPVPGNHEHLCRTEDEGLEPCEHEFNEYREHFVTPDDGRIFYDLDWGPLHVVMIDSEAYAPGLEDRYHADREAQEAFLRASLAERPDAWNVVVFHRSVYTTGTHHGSDLETRAALVPIIEAGGADLVLTGHEHLYERTWPLKGDAPTVRSHATRAVDGAVYVTSGGGGRELYDEWSDPAPWSAVRAAEREFLLVEADEHLLRVAAVRPDGSRLDAFSIAKDDVGVARQERDGAGPLARLVPAPGALAALVGAAWALRRR